MQIGPSFFSVTFDKTWIPTRLLFNDEDIENILLPFSIDKKSFCFLGQTQLDK